jgi:hypothetical protein
MAWPRLGKMWRRNGFKKFAATDFHERRFRRSRTAVTNLLIEIQRWQSAAAFVNFARR